MKLRYILAALLFAAPLSAQEAKNVQYLKGMTSIQLQRTMNFMRASLGVHCDYCHVVSDEKGWDWASDAKPEKEAGRKMIAMVIDMNTKYFEGHTDVTCNTCHRGSTRPVGQVPLPQAQPPFPTPKTERPPLPTRDEIVAKYAAAIGKVDENALASMTMKATREAPDGKTMPIALEQTGSSVRVNAGEQIVQVVTADSGWVKDDKPAREMNKGMVENQHQLADAFHVILPKEIPANARVVRKDKIGDRDAYIVQNATPSGRQRLWFDAQNGLLLRRVTTMATPIGDVPMQTDYSDYRDVAGMKLPFVVRVDSVDPWIGSTRKYSEIHVGAKIDPNDFVMPK